MKLPFEAALFMVPKGTIRHPVEGDIAYLGYSRFRPDDEHRSLFTGKVCGSKNDAFTMLALPVGSGNFFHWNIGAHDVGPTITIRDLDDLAASAGVHTSSWPLENLEMSPEDNRFVSTVAHYLFCTLLLMLDRPQIVTHGKLEKVVKRHDGPKEFWAPNVIGEGYKIRREGPVKDEHASPRLHPVRGFWRDQAHGPGWSLHTKRFIDPFWRGI